MGRLDGRVSIVTGGGAAALAAREIREKIEIVAAELLETSREVLRLAGGRIADTRSDRSLSLAEVAFAIYANAFGVARVASRRAVARRSDGLADYQYRRCQQWRCQR